MKATKIWPKILGYRIGDKVRITSNFQTLPYDEKGKLGIIRARSETKADVYLVEIDSIYVWLNEAYFEKVDEDD